MRREGPILRGHASVEGIRDDRAELRAGPYDIPEVGKATGPLAHHQIQHFKCRRLRVALPERYRCVR